MSWTESSLSLFDVHPADWRLCGSKEEACLQACLSQLRTSDLSETLLDGLSALKSRSLDEIRGVHHTQVERKWRRLHTDACILIGIWTARIGQRSEGRVAAMGALRDLDMAIIICGAPGYNRLEYIQRIIRALQGEMLDLDMDAHASSSGLGFKAAEDDMIPEGLPFCLASNSIKEVDSLPSFSAYLRMSSIEPFIVRSHAKDWPALQDPQRRWSDARYLARIAGPGRVVPVEIGRQYTEPDWRQDIIPWQEFLIASGWISHDTKGRKQEEKGDSIREDPKYLAQHNLFVQFPLLEADIITPDIVYSCPPAPSYFQEYKPPVDDEEGVEMAIMNAWIGPRGTTTPVHFDPYFNAYGGSSFPSF
jgi:hypothetical protein